VSLICQSLSYDSLFMFSVILWLFGGSNSSSMSQESYLTQVVKLRTREDANVNLNFNS
ncbi:unnamed protein product, partial [Linum tenue]